MSFFTKKFLEIIIILSIPKIIFTFSSILFSEKYKNGSGSFKKHCDHGFHLVSKKSKETHIHGFLNLDNCISNGVTCVYEENGNCKQCYEQYVLILDHVQGNFCRANHHSHGGFIFLLIGSLFAVILVQVGVLVLIKHCRKNYINDKDYESADYQMNAYKSDNNKQIDDRFLEESIDAEFSSKARTLKTDSIEEKDNNIKKSKSNPLITHSANKKKKRLASKIIGINENSGSSSSEQESFYYQIN